MVSKLTVRLIAAASSLALMAGGGNGSVRAKSVAPPSDLDRVESFESGALIERFLAAGVSDDVSAAKLTTELLLAELPVEEFPRLAELTRDLRRANLPPAVVDAAVGGMIDGVSRQGGSAISHDDAAAFTAQIDQARTADVQVADAQGSESPAGNDLGALPSPAQNQVAAVDLSVVGATDIVEREARGIIEEDIRELAIKDNVFFSEIVETGPDSALRIRLLDDTTLTLGPSSSVILDEFVYDPSTQDGRLSMRLLSGVFRFASGLMPKQNYSIGTPVGDIGIRGTILDFVISCTVSTLECTAIIDVTEGSGVLDHATGDADLNNGERTTATNDPNDVPESEQIPPDQPTLPEVITMQISLIEAATQLVEGQLPPGGIAAADLDELLAAVTQVLRENENISDLLLLSTGFTRPEFIDEIVASIAQAVPSEAETIAQLASTIEDEGEILGFFESDENGEPQPNGISQPEGDESEQSPGPYTGGTPN